MSSMPSHSAFFGNYVSDVYYLQQFQDQESRKLEWENLFILKS